MVVYGRALLFPVGIAVITKVTLKNFRCFQEAEAPLKGLTVLIGKNDSGKSAFLDALAILGHATQFNPGRDHWRLDGRHALQVSVYEGEGMTGCCTSGGVGLAASVWNRTSKYNLPSEGPSMLSEGLADSQGPPLLGADGAHVPALVDYLLRRDRKRYAKFVQAACDAIPGLSDISVLTPDASKREIELVIDDGLHIPANWTSVGVRVVLFFLALAHHPMPPRLILIEEPEKGVHPGRLADIVGLLRGLSDGSRSPEPAQVVLSTHSPYLLDSVEVDKDQVLIFERLDDGRRTITPADPERLRLFLDQFGLGEIWLNQGEEGLIAREKP
jgi:predicted ATPase